MISLARFILKGPSQAALVMTASAMLAIKIMPFSWLSAAALILVMLHQGKEAALKVTVIASLAGVVLSTVIFGTPLFAIGYLLFLWLPAGLISYILRQTVSMQFSLLVLTGIGFLTVTVIYLLFPEMGQAWSKVLEQILQQAVQQSGAQIDSAELGSLLNLFARAVPGLLAIVLVFNVLMGLFIGRWWQAVMFNPGGFSHEFNELRFGKSIATAAAVFMLLNVWLSNDWVMGVMLLLGSIILVQGMAVVHGVVAVKQLHKGWLFGFYFLLFVIPQMTIMLAIVGLLDAWVDFRNRASIITGK